MSFSTARLGWSEPIPAKPALACSANLRSQINHQSARGFGAGITESDDLPVTTDAPQTHRGGQTHAFWMIGEPVYQAKITLKGVRPPIWRSCSTCAACVSTSTNSCTAPASTN
jgi:hypothetical protein